jgi:predicted transposase/invertase (TIGR01784 family)
MDNTKHMSPFADTAFKRFFGQEENKLILIDFLNSLLVGERHITDVRYLDKEQIPSDDDGKNSIYDIFCDTDSGEKIIVEMQKCSHPNFIRRMVYYASKAVAKQGSKGEGWAYDVKAVYCIVLMNFVDSDIEQKVTTHVGLCDWENGEHFVDTLRFVFIQLPLFDKKEEECESFEDKWLYVLKNMDVLECLPETFQCEAFRKLKEVSDVSKLTEDERYVYERNLRNYRDALSLYLGMKKQGREEGRAEGLAEGEAKGLEKGRVEGEVKKAISIAKNMKDLGATLDMISKSTGLSVEEIEKL